MATITVMDPVTRIEGHLKVELTIDQGRVADARCSGTLFRGFEKILEGRDPRDAPVLTQRICGVCPVSHGLASSMAVEKAARVKPPTNARILRNLVLGSNYIQSHILHFYLLAALDYVKGPQMAPWTPAWTDDLKTDPALDVVASHLTQALEARRRAHQMLAIFGGKAPLPHTYIPGGFTSTPTAERISSFRGHLSWLITFIKNVYLPDVTAVGQAYSEYFQIGAGSKNLMAFGVFELDDAGTTKLLKSGSVQAGSTAVSALAPAAITEQVAYSWYDDASNNLNPANGTTTPVDPAVKTKAYSWLKAPRLGGRPYETGSLARMWVNGNYRQGISVMDRHVARALECLKVAQAMDAWLGQLRPGSAVAAAYVNPSSGSGIGMTEAPRGALGHWVQVTGGKLAKYQVVTPTCWNASPRDGQGVRGPMEQALVGTPVKDPNRPIEALRVIHSFDPCLSCAVHVMKPSGEPVVIHSPTTA